MSLGSINGHAPARPISLPPRSEREAALQRIEGALNAMWDALRLSGFEEYEAGQVNLATRAAITTVIKNRGRL